MATIQPVPDINPALPAFPGPNIPESQYDDQAYEWGTAIPGYGTRVKAIGDNVYNNAQAAAGILELVNDAKRLTELARDTAMGVANFKGDWNTLSGALTRPATVQHNNSVWLLMRDVANVAAEVPGTSTAWVNQTARVASVNGGSGDVVVNWANIPGRNATVTNLNDNTLTPDVYRIPGNVAGTRPGDLTGAAILVVSSSTSGLVHQRYLSPATGAEYVRWYSNTSWSVWGRVALQTDTVTQANDGKLNLWLGNYFTINVNGPLTITIDDALSGPLYGGSQLQFGLAIEVNYVSGSIAFNMSIKWAGGNAPTFVAGKKYIIFMQREKLGPGFWLCSAQPGYAA